MAKLRSAQLLRSVTLQAKVTKLSGCTVGRVILACLICIDLCAYMKDKTLCNFWSSEFSSETFPGGPQDLPWGPGAWGGAPGPLEKVLEVPELRSH